MADVGPLNDLQDCCLLIARQISRTCTMPASPAVLGSAYLLLQWRWKEQRL